MRTTNQRATGTDDRRADVERLVAAIGQSLRELRCVGSQRLVKAGISMTHLHVLTMLRHHGAMPMSRLAELLDISVSNATGLIDRLEERGYLERVRTRDDRRVVLVQPTEAAEQVIAEIDVLRKDLISAVLDRLDDGQLERLRAGLQAFYDALVAEFESTPDRYAHRRHEPGLATNHPGSFPDSGTVQPRQHPATGPAAH